MAAEASSSGMDSETVAAAAEGRPMESDRPAVAASAAAGMQGASEIAAAAAAAVAAPSSRHWVFAFSWQPHLARGSERRIPNLSSFKQNLKKTVKKSQIALFSGRM